MIALRPMTAEEYRDFYRQSFDNHVQELIEEEKLTEQIAKQETESMCFKKRKRTDAAYVPYLCVSYQIENVLMPVLRQAVLRCGR